MKVSPSQMNIITLSDAYSPENDCLTVAPHESCIVYDRRMAAINTHLVIEVLEHASLIYYDYRVFTSSAIERTIFLKAHEYASLTYESKITFSDVLTSYMHLTPYGSEATIVCLVREELCARQSHSIMSFQHHAVAYSSSRIMIRSVLHEHAVARYEGAITIAYEAYGTGAYQDHKALLLDPTTRAFARPSIEVKTDDVHCGHASAIGQLDQEHLWYLSSRGIEKKEAKRMLINSFLL